MLGSPKPLRHILVKRPDAQHRGQRWRAIWIFGGEQL